MVEDSDTNSVLKFSIDGLTNVILSTNIIVFYDIEIPALARTASAGFAITIPGDVTAVSASSKLSLQSTQPFNGYVLVYYRLTPVASATINRPAYFDIDYKSPANYDALITAHLNNQYKI